MIPRLLAFWYRVDRWPETAATVVSREEVIHTGGSDSGPLASAKIAFYYRDLNDEIQSGDLHLDDGSALYNLKQNDRFRIQFNPRRPSKYYCRDAVTYYTELPYVFWSAVAFVLLCGLALGFIRKLLLR